MKCTIEGTGHDLVMPNLKIIYRDTCDDTITEPIIQEVEGVTGQANMRIITIPCGGCDKCRQIRAYGCRIKDCSLEDGRNTKTREPFLLELTDSECTTINLAIINVEISTTNISTFATELCTVLENSIGITGMFGDVVITGPVPAFAEQYTVAIIRNGVCEPQDIAPFTAGDYILENCGITITINNSTPAP